ncbi:carbohydrate ABC transporter permease [Paenibacillus montanisoli]|uniref:Carbohydrate ABC transporter permease n=1 Tax=Paenibacillus montanisoli TaxID=2081970 RepID=A0A328U336_9BACL|nr:carbohydrate ABC transporter permease [Paenibacillus montanisoli]RAP77217.1 carbohydrate ABC transporter permease [Paenibacillus montanisoli]
MNAKHTQKSWSDAVFDYCNYAILTFAMLLVLYPLYFVLIASVSDPTLVSGGKVWLWPQGFRWTGYEAVFGNSAIMTGFRNSLMYVVIGTAINLVLTLPAAYSLSRKDLKGRGIFTFYLVVTMFFGGGLIPTYMLVKDLGMLNTIWAMVIPGAVSVWNIIICRTFFQSTLPTELLEAAIVDGCTNKRFFFSIVIPLSTPLIAVMVLFCAVGYWNSYFSALIYLKDHDLYPLQMILREILVQNSLDTSMIKDRALLEERQHLSELIKYAVIIVASVPVLILYPFLQKYFVKGIMIGSIKG